MAEPDKFYIGVVDLFSVILPGAVLTYVAHLNHESLVSFAPALAGIGDGWTDVEGWSVFLVASYVLGHFVFLFGALLDNPIYDRLRRATPWNQQRLAAQHKPLAWPLTARFAKMLFGADPDGPIACILELKTARLPDWNGRPVVNAFQWAKARLAVLSPAGLAEVQRYEADSKFFRSFAVVLFLLVVVSGARALQESAGWPLVLASVFLLLLSLWRYIERRFKSTQLAYWQVLTLETSPGVAKAPEA